MVIRVGFFLKIVNRVAASLNWPFAVVDRIKQGLHLTNAMPNDDDCKGFWHIRGPWLRLRNSCFCAQLCGTLDTQAILSIRASR